MQHTIYYITGIIEGTDDRPAGRRLPSAFFELQPSSDQTLAEALFPDDSQAADIMETDMLEARPSLGSTLPMRERRPTKRPSAKKMQRTTVKKRKQRKSSTKKAERFS